MRFDFSNDIYNDYKSYFEQMNIDKDLLGVLLNENYPNYIYSDDLLMKIHDHDKTYKIVDESNNDTSIKNPKLSIICDSNHFDLGIYCTYITNGIKKIIPHKYDFAEIYFSKNKIDIFKIKNNDLYIENLNLEDNSININIYLDFIISNQKLKYNNKNIIDFFDELFEEQRIVPDIKLNNYYDIDKKRVYMDIYEGNKKKVFSYQYRNPNKVSEMYEEICTNLGNNCFTTEEDFYKCTDYYNIKIKIKKY